MATLVSGRASDSRIKIHLLDFEFSGALAGLDDDVDEHVQQPTDIVASQIASALGFLHQQRQLLERARRRAGLDGRDRTWMARLDVAQLKAGRTYQKRTTNESIRQHA